MRAGFVAAPSPSILIALRNAPRLRERPIGILTASLEDLMSTLANPWVTRLCAAVTRNVAPVNTRVVNTVEMSLLITAFFEGTLGARNRFSFTHTPIRQGLRRRV